jgi:hypothetical protein
MHGESRLRNRVFRSAAPTARHIHTV